MIRQIASNLEKQDNAKDENEQSGEDDGKRDENDIDGELHMNEPLVDAAKVLLGLFMWHEIVHEQIAHAETQGEHDEADNEALVEAQREELGAHEREIEHDEPLHGEYEKRVDRHGAEYVPQIGQELAAEKALVDEVELAGRVRVQEVHPRPEREVDIVQRQHEHVRERQQQEVDGQLLLCLFI